jgi:hypothetical protein
MLGSTVFTDSLSLEQGLAAKDVDGISLGHVPVSRAAQAVCAAGAPLMTANHRIAC